MLAVTLGGCDLALRRASMRPPQARLELAFDNSSASNALRHTVFSGVVAWGCLALLGVAGTPQGSMRKRIWLWRAVLAATWGITLTATALSLQYLTMCGETTQLLHMIPFWLRGVEVRRLCVPMLCAKHVLIPVRRHCRPSSPRARTPLRT